MTRRVPDSATPAPELAPGVPELQARQIAIVGYTVSREDAPWGDPGWELWPVNNLHLFLKPEQKPTRWFDLHGKATIESDGPHVEWLKSTDVPVYLWDSAMREEYGSALPFPIGHIETYFDGLFGGQYFTNSISYLIAYAIYCLKTTGDGTGVIGLWGIDMAQGTEYSAQRPSCEYWLGIAEGAGLTVHIADRADLLKAMGQYGRDESLNHFMVKMRARTEELETRLEGVNGEIGQMLSELEMKRYEQHQLVGALESQRYVEGVWGLPGDVRKGKDDPSMTEQEKASSG